MLGIIPAAGAGQRIQPLGCSKELLPVGSRQVKGVERPKAVAEYLVERMIAAGAKQITAFPMDPKTRRVRDGTRLNQLIVVRIAASSLSEETRSRAADGVVAYSGVCTHTGCDVTDWVAPAQHLKCPCHESEYDPGDAARVVSGPAPWQLAALPLKIVDGVLAVAAPFVGKVGFAQPGSPSGE